MAVVVAGFSAFAIAPAFAAVLFVVILMIAIPFALTLAVSAVGSLFRSRG